MAKKKNKHVDETSAEEVTEGIQKLVQGNIQETIVIDQEEDEPQGPDVGDVVEENEIPKLEVVEGEVVGEKVEDPAAIAQLSKPPFVERVQQERITQQPNAMVENLKKTIFDKHANRGQLAVEFAKAILSGQGLKSNTEQIVKRSFEITDGIQVEIDRGYNAEMTKRITGQ